MKKRKIRLLRHSRSFKVIEVGTNRKPICEFLLVINSNWQPISYRCGVIIIIFIHRSHGRSIQTNKKCTKKKKKTHTEQSSSAYTYCINGAIFIMQKNTCIYLFDVTSAEFYRHDCRISKTSLVSLTTNMLHNLFCDTVISSRNFHLMRLAIVDSADKQLNISRHSFTVSWDSVSKSFLSALDSKIQLWLAERACFHTVI